MFFFNLYSWITGIMWAGGELLPQFIRNPLFKVLLKSYGKNSMIDYKTYIRYPAQVRIGSGTTINRGVSFLHHTIVKMWKYPLETMWRWPRM